MWILQIAHCYYPPFLDCARQYSKLFSNSDYKVLTVYLTGQPDEEVARKSCSDEVIFLGYKSKQVSGLKLAAIIRIRKIALEKDFVFCIAHRAKPTYVALLATRLPVISVRHNYGDFKRLSRRILVNFFKDRLCLLGVSNSVRDEMRSFLTHWPADRIQTLYNRIDADALQAGLLTRQEARQFLRLPESAWLIGNVGRLHRDKDQATLIQGFAEAMAELPSTSLLVIMGSGPLEVDLKQLASSLGITSRVTFTGQIADGWQYFKAFDVFALTSDAEPFGMVLLEAMAADVPIICSDGGGGAEVVAGAGEIFPFGNAKHLALSLVKLSVNANTASLECAKRILNSKFSDEAAKLAFWNLNYVRYLTGQKVEQ